MQAHEYTQHVLLRNQSSLTVLLTALDHEEASNAETAYYVTDHYCSRSQRNRLLRVCTSIT